MFIDFLPFSNRWLNLNHYITQKLSFNPSKGSICIYKSLSHALQEVSFGLVKLFPHKKNIYYFKNMSPHFQPLLLDLKIERDINVKALDLSVLKNPKPFFKELSSKDLLLIYAKDDPMLGYLFENSTLNQAFNQEALIKKFFLISISHNTHFYDSLHRDSLLNFKKNSTPPAHSIGMYNIDLYSYGQRGALAFLGLRSKKIENFLASKLSWEKKDYDKMSSFLRSHFIRTKRRKNKDELDTFESRKSRILNFEKERFGGFKSFFLNSSSRTFDRSVIYWEDMDGYAFIASLSKALGFSLLKPGNETRIETTSLTRWGGVHTMDWLKFFNLSDHQIRGLVLIDVSLINDRLPDLIEKTRKKVLALQEG